MNVQRYKDILDAIYKFASWLHLWIFFIILAALCIGIVGFIYKWFGSLHDPAFVIDDFHELAEDIFSLILVFEIMQLLRQQNPRWLTDIVLTVLARKILLSGDSGLVLMETISFCLVLLCRIIWNKFVKERSSSGTAT